MRRCNRCFTPDEVQAIFDANAGMIEALLPDYVDHLGNEGQGSLGDLYIRRGVYVSAVETDVRKELHCLTSYSLALGPVEQFTQTWTPQTRDNGNPTIFAAPLAAAQNRVVAFAPFIANMDLRQLEFVVARPWRGHRLLMAGYTAVSKSFGSFDHTSLSVIGVAWAAE